MVICKKCGTTDCISSKEYKKHIKISGAGVLSISSAILMKSCKWRQQLNSLIELRELRIKCK